MAKASDITFPRMVCKNDEQAALGVHWQWRMIDLANGALCVWSPKEVKKKETIQVKGARVSVVTAEGETAALFQKLMKNAADAASKRPPDVAPISQPAFLHLQLPTEKGKLRDICIVIPVHSIEPWVTAFKVPAGTPSPALFATSPGKLSGVPQPGSPLLATSSGIPAGSSKTEKKKGDRGSGSTRPVSAKDPEIPAGRAGGKASPSSPVGRVQGSSPPPRPLSVGSTPPPSSLTSARATYQSESDIPSIERLPQPSALPPQPGVAAPARPSSGPPGGGGARQSSNPLIPLRATLAKSPSNTSVSSTASTSSLDDLYLGMAPPSAYYQDEPAVLEDPIEASPDLPPLEALPAPSVLPPPPQLPAFPSAPSLPPAPSEALPASELPPQPGTYMMPRGRSGPSLFATAPRPSPTRLPPPVMISTVGATPSPAGRSGGRSTPSSLPMGRARGMPPPALGRAALLEASPFDDPLPSPPGGPKGPEPPAQFGTSTMAQLDALEKEEFF